MKFDRLNIALCDLSRRMPESGVAKIRRQPLSNWTGFSEIYKTVIFRRVFDIAQSSSDRVSLDPQVSSNSEQSHCK